MLLKLQRSHRSSRQVVIESSVLHRRPVPDICLMEHRTSTVPLNELLDGLRSIEHSGSRITNDRQSIPTHGDHVAFRLHLIGKPSLGVPSESRQLDLNPSCRSSLNTPRL